MSVVIKEIRGKKGFFHSGDEIISIGGRDVNDQLDIFYLTADGDSAEFVIRRKSGGVVSKKLGFRTFNNYELSYEEMSFINCRSKCIFCFVDQTPPGLRETLYQKDDDYRLSFLFGNYVTLNDITPDDIKRIIEYNLSPLYVSVHSTDKKVRENIFGRPLKMDIIDILGSLSARGIIIHCQVVIVPGINDGKSLEKTVDDLIGLYPGCRSLALVPVGLTRHRGSLCKLNGFTKQGALNLLRLSEKMRKNNIDKTEGEPFLFPSDEFYLVAGEKLPEETEYGAFDQLSNGVGMARLFIEDIRESARALRNRGITGISMTVVTGVLGSVLMEEYIDRILSEYLPDHRIVVVTVNNRLFGEKVTVSGLLCGRDIIDSVKECGMVDGPIMLPPNCINHEGLLLDDLKIEDIRDQLGIDVFVPENNFLEKDVIQYCTLRERKR